VYQQARRRGASWKGVVGNVLTTSAPARTDRRHKGPRPETAETTSPAESGLTPFGGTDSGDAMMPPIDISLVIPTYNERENIAALLARIEPAVAGQRWEAVFVDDSTDGTDALIADLARTDPRIRLLHREENRGGLAGAVVDGLAQAHGTYVCVLDADLQHPPDRIPALLAEARRTSADLVIASRYTDGGSAGGLDGPLRQIVSRGLKALSQVLFPRRLAGISDPLGGFFLVRRSVVTGFELRPIGYKILLEILVRCRWQIVREVPYVFQPRLYCDSKADLRQGVRFLHHLSKLFLDCSPVFAMTRERPVDRSLQEATPAVILPRER
jgi:dolichol-phosphate mannosyltransferase